MAGYVVEGGHLRGLRPRMGSADRADRDGVPAGEDGWRQPPSVATMSQVVAVLGDGGRRHRQGDQAGDGQPSSRTELQLRDLVELVRYVALTAP